MNANGIVEWKTKSGGRVLCEWFNTPLRGPNRDVERVLSMGIDVTDHSQLEARYRQSQKMEAFGLLAGGVAHEFNNLLTIISGYSEILLQQSTSNDSIFSPLTEISRASERAAALTRHLLAFSRKQVVVPRLLNLNDLVVNTEKMLRRIIGEDIRFRSELAPNLDAVHADPGQIEQVLLNLVVNARDAMPTGGNLTIETQNVEFDDSSAWSHVDIRAGRYVLVAVSDTGCGMTPEIKARIVEPFFTAKAPSKGTGLGLATVFGIVKQANGHVGVHSEPGFGTSFKIYLPSAGGSVKADKSQSIAAPLPKGSETILIVEDEDAVRSLARGILSRCGYKVLDACNGELALYIAKAHPEPIHLLVTDVVMPGIGGRKVAEAMRELQPQVRTLFWSGYADDAIVRHGILKEVPFLQKPFTGSTLAIKVRSVLDQV